LCKQCTFESVRGRLSKIELNYKSDGSSALKWRSAVSFVLSSDKVRTFLVSIGHVDEK
jgi:hypothetical protein